MWIINEWHAIYEKAESRRWNSISWVRMPNTHGGRGYRRLIRQPGGLEAFACFVLMVQVASRMPRRGVLVGPEGPLSALDLEDMTFVPREKFEAAFEAVSAPEIQWISWVEDVPADFDLPDRMAMTRAAPLTTRAAPRAAPLPDNSVAPAQNGFDAGLNGITQCEHPPTDEPERTGPAQNGFDAGQKPQVRIGEDRIGASGAPSAVEIRETLARLVNQSDAEAEAEAGFPEPQNQRVTKNEITRMAQCFRTYAQHLTKSAWPLPDWKLATKAANVTKGKYSEAESILKASALAKVPRGAPAVEMRSYALPLKILADHFQNRSTQPPEHL